MQHNALEIKESSPFLLLQFVNCTTPGANILIFPEDTSILATPINITQT